jgi:hypothetical protein
MTDGDIVVVSLRNVVDLDPSVFLLADLPMGWVAIRESTLMPWRRHKLADAD